jgi:5-methylcytosine-specific restriction endonuclease McrBC GTP-binding regulatory subunit McrB
LIDEINRGNLSKIFGELLLLIEADKRNASWATSLTYSTEKDEPFYIPRNVHIIGTMNTADRGLAMVDYALRRRFAFLPLNAAFESDGFKERLNQINVDPELQVRLSSRLTVLNQHIAEDSSLGDGFCIGHSYFCRTAEGVDPDAEWYSRIVRTEIKPLLEEYWFDSRERAEEEVGQLLDEH